VTGWLAVLLLLGTPVAAAAAAEPCRAVQQGGGEPIESTDYLLVYRTTPAPIVLGQHFSMEVVVCAKAGAPAPGAVRVDAHMPEHRHGMNYRPTVSAAGPGRYRAEGLLFHMPGHWELVFEVRAPGGTPQRLTRSVVVE
jgi:hypothetical protein